MRERIVKTDARIYEDVLSELRWDTRVKETHIGITVDRGVVTLAGHVDTWIGRNAARAAAHRVDGVLDVVDELHVEVAGTHERSDADIARAARTALEWNALVPHERVRMTVAKGVLTLEGVLETWAEHDEATRAVGHLTGVREVRNLLVVEPPRVAEGDVRSAIDRALDRHAAHAAKHVAVTIDDGVVTLTGTVPSFAEREAVVGAARGTRGVRKVESRIHVG